MCGYDSWSVQDLFLTFASQFFSLSNFRDLLALFSTIFSRHNTAIHSCFIKCRGKRSQTIGFGLIRMSRENCPQVIWDTLIIILHGSNKTATEIIEVWCSSSNHKEQFWGAHPSYNIFFSHTVPVLCQSNAYGLWFSYKQYKYVVLFDLCKMRIVTNFISEIQTMITF